MQEHYCLRRKGSTSRDVETLLFKELWREAARAKSMSPVDSFSISVEDSKHNICGGVTGTIIYGSVYVDMLWIKANLRHQGWGTKLMQEVEKITKESGCSFITLHTMDWEALPFYQKIGYTLEFTREGYENESKMFMLRKNL